MPTRSTFLRWEINKLLACPHTPQNLTYRVCPMGLSTAASASMMSHAQKSLTNRAHLKLIWKNYWHLCEWVWQDTHSETSSVMSDLIGTMIIIIGFILRFSTLYINSIINSHLWWWSICVTTAALGQIYGSLAANLNPTYIHNRLIWGRISTTNLSIIRQPALPPDLQLAKKSLMETAASGYQGSSNRPKKKNLKKEWSSFHCDQ